MIVVLDGPAGAGKSSVSKKLAKRLGVEFMDTGAMYRAFTWRAMQKKVDLLDVPALVRCVDEGRLFMTPERVTMDGIDVTTAIRTPEVTGNIFRLSDSGPVRERLNEQQRALATALKSFVAEGRDLGTVVFPDADVKIYLDASSDVRARRRLLELKKPESELASIKKDIEERDRKDMVRPVAPLKRAEDAVHVDTSDLALDAVVERLEQIVRDGVAGRSGRHR
ncbi:MAG: (d)CMP kinase [Planctomycetota bacterium]